MHNTHTQSQSQTPTHTQSQSQTQSQTQTRLRAQTPSNRHSCGHTPGNRHRSGAVPVHVSTATKAVRDESAESNQAAKPSAVCLDIIINNNVMIWQQQEYISTIRGVTKEKTAATPKESLLKLYCIHIATYLPVLGCPKRHYYTATSPNKCPCHQKLALACRERTRSTVRALLCICGMCGIYIYKESKSRSRTCPCLDALPTVMGLMRA